MVVLYARNKNELAEILLEQAMEGLRATSIQSLPHGEYRIEFA